ncbi:phenoloxidase-activating factor 3-like [Neocloeon triangulifer]|uniref:phenoloxidase-activating factor 3-like n=1 Tax=Neocloeon triangulifer TaxID=2078957 RepID=UPI00286EFBB4|nr:phenoloxidase-activating factor 3-like [Neocloeon triangulifer]
MKFGTVHSPTLILLFVISFSFVKSQLLDVGLCISSTASCMALSDCRLVAELMDRQCLAPGRLRDMTCGYSNATRQPLVCCPSKDTGLSQPGSIPDYTTTGGDDDGNDPSTSDIQLSNGSSETDGGSTSSSSGGGLPIFNVCGLPQLIAGTPSRIPLQAGPTRLGAHPWVVRLGHRNLNSGVTEFYGAGVLITEKHVLTAAHCLNMKGSNYRLVTVRVGEYDTSSNPDCSQSLCAIPAKDIPILKTAVHPNYDESSSYNHDIMIITLQSSVNFTINVQPVCVLTRTSANLVGRRALVVGYGRLANAQKVHALQQALEVPIVPTSTCQRFYTKYGFLDNRLCAGGEPGRDMCQGFSGAPLFVRAGGVGAYFVAGIRSFGSDQCGIAGSANVYTQVSRYTAFIRNQLN